jgi:16S rRNA C1402 (ribose-2'-O) methylase RsmI
MANTPEELAEEMASIRQVDMTPDLMRDIKAITDSPQGLALLEELTKLHEELVAAPIAANLKKIQECQWKIFQLSCSNKRRLN